MEFKVKASKHRGTQYEFIVQGSGNWGMEDILPYMLKVSKTSTHYKVQYDFRSNPPLKIVDNRAEGRVASLSLEDTVIPEIKKLRVFDKGIGTQMIHKFLKSVESCL